MNGLQNLLNLIFSGGLSMYIMGYPHRSILTIIKNNEFKLDEQLRIIEHILKDTAICLISDDGSLLGYSAV
jgi:hypothetical protein